MKSTIPQLMLVCLLSASSFAQSANLGIFTNSGDVGGPAIKGSAEFNASNGQYKITGVGRQHLGQAGSVPICLARDHRQLQRHRHHTIPW